jgi:hypothetical protein
MKLYHFAGTWQLPGQQDKGASRVEIPTDASGLCHWLNERRVRIAMPLQEPVNGPQSTASPSAPISGPSSPATLSASEIEAFILDRASVAEVERIFACMGTRFAEARRP